MDIKRNYKYRILLGLQEVAGYYTNLKKGFQELGVECTFINLRGHKFVYGGDDIPNFSIQLTKYVGQKLNGSLKRLPAMSYLQIGEFIILSGIEQFLKFFVFLWAVKNFDIFIFGANSSFFFFMDLPILKLLNKKIIYVFHGSDSRPLYLNGSIMQNEKKINVRKILLLTKLQKYIIRFIEKHADALIEWPPLAYFHQKKFIQGLVIGIPYESPIMNRKDVKRKSASVRILHAPSNPLARGTPLIREMIKRLQKKGHNINYIEISGKPNSVVVQEIEKCDFVVDEMYSDTPLAGLGTEAAFFGKPVVVGGYYADYVVKDVPQKYIPPSMFCLPERMEAAIEQLITDEKLRLKIGRKARLFIHSQWSPENVAKKFINIIEDRIPKEWWYDPHNIKYLYGYGLSKDRVKFILKKLVKSYGIEGLQLNDKELLLYRYRKLLKIEE